MPDWLRLLCGAWISTFALGIEACPVSESTLCKFVTAESDRGVWPYLPEGKLEARPDDSADTRFLDQMTSEERHNFVKILLKPEERWTRREAKFVRECFNRQDTCHI